MPRQQRSDVGLETWRADTQRGKPATSSHRRSSRLRRLADLLRRRTKVVHVASGRTRRRGLIADLPIGRRRLLLGIGTGAVVATGVGTAATLITKAFSSGGPGSRPNTWMGSAPPDLPTLPLPRHGSRPRPRPRWPTPLGRDPELHLLRRATFGPTLVDVVAARQIGIDAWLERQLNPTGISDPFGDQIPTWYPTIGMSTAQIRAALEANSGKAMTELGRAHIGPANVE